MRRWTSGCAPGWSAEPLAGLLEDVFPGFRALGALLAGRARVEDVGGIRLRGQPVDQAERSRAEITDRAARHEQVEGLAAMHDPREPGDAAPGGDQAEMDLGQARLQGCGGGQRHPATAGQGELQPTAQAGAMDDGDVWGSSSRPAG